MILSLSKNRGRGRGLGRPKSVFTVMVLIALVYYCLLKGEEIRLARVTSEKFPKTITTQTVLEVPAEDFGQIQPPPAQDEAPGQEEENNVPPTETTFSSTEAIPEKTQAPSPIPAPEDNTPEPVVDPAERARQIQAEYAAEYEALRHSPGAGLIYGATVAKLKNQNTRSSAQEKDLSKTEEQRFAFNPYPKYNSREWRAAHDADHVPCDGPAGSVMRDIGVFKGWPWDFPEPGFGSYEVLGMDKNLCFERGGRLGQYGLQSRPDGGEFVEWSTVDWGLLQNQCVRKNKDRFGSAADDDSSKVDRVSNETKPRRESRTAVLLRSYTGKEYSENDKQAIRSMVTELNLRTGGEYQVYLFVHVKRPDDIFGDRNAYQFVMQKEVPREFWGMTVLWNDDSVRRMYPKLDETASKVHNAQYLSVQKFMHEHREFDFVWNWEVDSRAVGHQYDFVSKLAEFSKRQPRKGLWERNERFYIRDVHGEYDGQFRKTIEVLYGNDTVWGAPEVAGVTPLGPKPPTRTPQEDDYQWGVGEEADLITLSPIFNPVNSGWILGGEIWGFGEVGKSLPRRATIITQSRLSRRLLDLMHAEDRSGNHVASEMMPQTIALLHGLKAVYAPMPVFFDRPWTGVQLERWFNGGPRRESGGFGSAMGWGRERRFQGSTWYYRADPPQRMYNNWMGYEDTGFGGDEWERVHGRPCLPALMFHPIKDVRERGPGYESKSDLPYR
ncbi:hypothetical protein QBC37DRAFT_63327 [Rhypophila decipiens]|uniref:Major facilitator superfamily transporter n=1 Tax=Rhypophila decipiens TaxID=261697 RepID=A0AAN7BBF4_9PEZI|nr:hypothetical protein QBC37DRAFT_63327 [Rhypophila decipiens]